MKYLSYRPRSLAEVTRYLRTKTSDAALINQTLDFLKKYKLVDDAAFARWLIESRSRSRPRGSRLLKQELKQKGIDLTSVSLPDVDEKTLAFQALNKKQPLWSGLSGKDYRLKATRYLTTRGFSWEVIAETVKKGYNDLHVNR